MLSRVCFATFNGIEAYPVEVEVDSGWGDANVVIVVNIIRSGTGQKHSRSLATLRDALLPKLLSRELSMAESGSIM